MNITAHQILACWRSVKEEKYIPIVLLMRDLLSSIVFQQANNLKTIGIPSKMVGFDDSVDLYGLNKSVCF